MVDHVERYEVYSRKAITDNTQGGSGDGIRNIISVLLEEESIAVISDLPILDFILVSCNLLLVMQDEELSGLVLSDMDAVFIGLLLVLDIQRSLLEFTAWSSDSFEFSCCIPFVYKRGGFIKSCLS